MISWFKRHLVPHGANNHRPHLLHGEGARTTIIMVLVFEIFVFLLPTVSFYEHAKTNMAAVLPAVLGTLTNEQRHDQAVPELTVNPVLTRAAELKAQDMAERGYFAHTSPEGKTPWYWLKTVGYDYQYAGENLAINFNDSKDVTAAWMNSAGHRANIVKAVYTEVGTGVATGIYEGRETVFVAQVYASPLAAVVPVPLVEPQNTTPTRDTSRAVVVATPEALEQNVLGAESPVQAEVIPDVVLPGSSVDTPTITQRAQASPAHTTNTILMVVMGIVTAVVVLTILIKINTQHPDLITNGMAVVAVIGGIVIGNNFLSSNHLQTSQAEYVHTPEIVQSEW